MPQIEQTYLVAGKLVYIFKNFPLPGHAQAQIAAEAAACAGLQGKFWPMHDQIYLNQQDWSGKDTALDVLLGYGTKLGLNQTAFQTCLSDHQMAQKIKDDYAYGQSIGVPATPAFLVAGKGLTGAQPFSVFQQVIDQALGTNP